jgi:hypothetical protein
MKYSYTHANKTYSVVALKDGSILEIRRGERTFPAEDKADQQTWASLDAWKATWPADASPSFFSTSRSSVPSPSASPSASSPDFPVDRAIIDRIFTDSHPNLRLGVPSAPGIRELKKDIRGEEWLLKNYYGKKAKLESYDIQSRDWYIKSVEKKKQRLATCHTLPFHHAIDTCRVSAPHVYVSCKGIMMPVYFNRECGVVIICEYDPTEKRRERKIHRPEELGVTADSTFYRLNKYTHMFVPV